MAVDVQIGGEETLFVGEDKTFDLEVLDIDGVPVNTAAWAGVVFDVRKADTSSAALFSKTTTVVGVYNVVRATNTQRRRAILTDTEMNTVKAGTYRHSWKRTDDGFETVIAKGDFVVQKATAP